jgi:hypothetical protein
MARRANAKLNSIWIGLFTLLILGAIAGGYAVYNYAGNPYRTLQSLDIPAYLENGNSLRGNVYKVEVTIQNQLAWNPTTGRLFSVEVKNGDNAEVIGVLIPSNFNQINIQKGQRYFFKIEVGKDGILQAKDLTKV